MAHPFFYVRLPETTEMPILRQSAPAYATTGTLVAPEDDSPLALARQISLEGSSAYDSNEPDGLDLASFLVCSQGRGLPVTAGQDQTVSLLYRDLDNDNFYVRVSFRPNVYVKIQA